MKHRTGSLSMCATLVVLAGAPVSLGATPFPPVLDLATLTGPNGFVVNGAATFDNSGRAVASCGDLNSDGIDDFVVGAPGVDPAGRAQAGAAYVVFGAPGVGAGGAVDLASLNGANGFVLNGIGPGNSAGFAVAGAGDVNGDGVDDLLIGAVNASPLGRSGAGETYVVFGSDTIGATGSFELSSLDGTNGFAIAGIDANEQSGSSVAPAGDVNGDGVGDILIGATRASPNSVGFAGRAHVVFGGPTVGASGMVDLAAITGSEGFALNGTSLFDRVGTSVSGAGDVNGDGFADVLLGAYHATPDGRTYAGEAYIVFGGPTVAERGPVELSELSGADGFVINGVDDRDYAGGSVSCAGDVNGDGFADIIVGAKRAGYGYTRYAGECYVVFGAPDVGASGALEFSALTGTNGFLIPGVGFRDSSGWSVACAGDVNGDGLDDLIIGAPYANPHGLDRPGESYVVYGATTIGASGLIELDGLDGSNGFVVTGVNAVDRSGSAVSSAGDVNGDGLSDFIIGAWSADPHNLAESGASFVVLGRSPVICPADINNDARTNGVDFNTLAAHFGETVVPFTSGDVTGDGLVDFTDFNVLAGDFGCGG